MSLTLNELTRFNRVHIALYTTFQMSNQCNNYYDSIHSKKKNIVPKILGLKFDLGTKSVQDEEFKLRSFNSLYKFGDKEQSSNSI